MRPCTPHYVLTQEPTIVFGKHFYASSTIADSCVGLVQTLLHDRIITNTTHGDVHHFLGCILHWWLDIARRRADSSPSYVPRFDMSKSKSLYLYFYLYSIIKCALIRHASER